MVYGNTSLVQHDDGPLKVRLPPCIVQIGRRTDHPNYARLDYGPCAICAGEQGRVYPASPYGQTEPSGTVDRVLLSMANPIPVLSGFPAVAQVDPNIHTTREAADAHGADLVFWVGDHGTYLRAPKMAPGRQMVREIHEARVPVDIVNRQSRCHCGLRGERERLCGWFRYLPLAMHHW
jgi:hypothetical protein